jgi:hypothetical protein
MVPLIAALFAFNLQACRRDNNRFSGELMQSKLQQTWTTYQYLCTAMFHCGIAASGLIMQQPTAANQFCISKKSSQSISGRTAGGHHHAFIVCKFLPAM